MCCGWDIHNICSCHFFGIHGISHDVVFLKIACTHQVFNKMPEEKFFIVWHFFWLSLPFYPFMRLTCVFHYYIAGFWVFVLVYFSDKSTFNINSHGHIRKKSKAEAASAVECISSRRIGI